MTNIGHNQPPHVSVNSLTEQDKAKVKRALLEINDSLTRISSERQLVKDIIDKVNDEVGLDKKLVRRMAKAYFKANFSEEEEQNSQFEDFYKTVMQGGN